MNAFNFIDYFIILVVFPYFCGKSNVMIEATNPIPREQMAFPGPGGKMQYVNVEGLEKLFGNMPNGGSIIFQLYNRKDPDTYEPMVLYKYSEKFLPGKPLVVLIHGWKVTADSLSAIKDAYLKVSDINVLSVDWSQIAGDLYTMTAPRTRYVGEKVGELLLDLINSAAYHIDASKVYIVGHSLGAHAASYAGRYLKNHHNTVRRITGLDPASPLFETPEVVGGINRFEAYFVEIIHTNAGLLGVMKRRGDVDFYVNGGGPIQPGCGPSFTKGIICSHLRVIEYFAESIRTGGFIGNLCESYIAFKSGQCYENDKQHLGDFTNENAKGTYYLSTNSAPPYSRE